MYAKYECMSCLVEQEVEVPVKASQITFDMWVQVVANRVAWDHTTKCTLCMNPLLLFRVFDDGGLLMMGQLEKGE